MTRLVIHTFNESISQSVNLNSHAAVLLDLFLLDTAFGDVDPQQAALKSGLQLSDLDIVGQRECASPGSDLALREQNRGFGVVAKFGLDRLA